MNAARVALIICSVLTIQVAESAAGEVTAASETTTDALELQERADDVRLLVTVGEWPVFVEDLERALEQLHSGVRAAQRSAPDVNLLIRRRLVADALLAAEASAIGMAEEYPIPSRLGKLVEKMSAERLEREEIVERAGVSDEEVLKVFRNEYRSVTFHRAVLSSQEEALEFRRRIEKGGDFEGLAKQRAVDAIGRAGGLVERFSLVNLPQQVAAQLLRGGPKELTTPIQSDEGWAIYRLDAVVEADEETLPSVQASIRENLEMSRQREARDELVQKLAQKHEVAVDEAVVEAIGCEFGTNDRLVPVVRDLEEIVARVGGRVVRAGELRKALTQRWLSVTSKEAALATRPLVLDRLIGRELIIAEAMARNYGESEPIRRARHALLTGLLVDEYLAEVVSGPIRIEEGETEEYYEEHKEDFRRPPRLRIGQITVADSESADEVAAMLRDGADLAWLARQRSTDAFRDGGGDRGWVIAGRPLSPFTGKELRTDEVGKVLGPTEWDDQFVVARINSVEDQGVFSLSEVAGKVEERLRSEKFRQRLQYNLDELQARSKIVFYEDNIAELSIAGSGQEDQPMGHGPH